MPSESIFQSSAFVPAKRLPAGKTHKRGAAC